MDSTCCTPEQLELIGITSEQILYVFGWGFGAVVFCWWLGFVIGAGINMIKKL